jgi:hypothetical protein
MRCLLLQEKPVFWAVIFWMRCGGKISTQIPVPRRRGGRAGGAGRVGAWRAEEEQGAADAEDGDGVQRLAPGDEMEDGLGKLRSAGQAALGEVGSRRSAGIMRG